MTLSVIIPVWNDSAALAECLDRLKPGETQAEIIVADASDPRDGSERVRILCADHGVRLIRCPTPSRGGQLRAGADIATGDVLVFSHADSELTPAHLDAIGCAFESDRQLKAGAFRRDVAPFYPRLTWLAPVIHEWMQRFGILYGDQSPFVDRGTLRSIGGYPDLPIMEDIALSDRLHRRLSRRELTVLPLVLGTSPRRFRRRGSLSTRLQNIILIWLWRLRLASPDRIHRWYYSKGK